jgi:hypothetical protein
MKTLLIAASLICSASAFAIDANSSWSEINASYKTDVKAPQVGFAAGNATSFYSIFETCVDGDMVKTIEAKDVFEQVRHGKNDVELVVVGQEVLSHAKTYKETINVGGHGSSREVEITVTIPTNNMIDVYSKVAKNQEATKLFSKAFSIPACK